ncbi:hypothetical protein EJB05_29108, partial [Eragrostis curvula]
MVAHVGDFGLARFKSDSSRSYFAHSNSTSSLAINGNHRICCSSVTNVQSTECSGSGQVSAAADVYSFRVVLLEIFIRKKLTDDLFKDGMSIAKFTEINFPDDVLQIVDSQVLQDLDISQDTTMAITDTGVGILLFMLDIGIRCTKPLPNEHINMQEDAAMLHGIKDATSLIGQRVLYGSVAIGMLDTTIHFISQSLEIGSCLKHSLRKATESFCSKMI